MSVVLEKSASSRMERLAAEGERVPAQWNDTRKPFFEGCIHHLFESQVRARPDAVAVAEHGRSLTYGELDRAANSLAVRLIELGVRPDTLVGLCIPRSIELIVGVLGILKAGGAYVPLDPFYPLQRVQYMLQDSQVRWVVGTAQTHAIVGDAATFVDLANVLDTSDATAECGISVHVGSHHLAYAVYTSGSTGQPKASLLEHRGLCNMAQEQQRMYGTNASSKVLQFASMSFDAATSEWVMALTAGGQLCLVDEQTVKSPAALSQYVADTQITHATLPPVLLPLLDPEQWRSVRTLLVAGEACGRETAELWSAGRDFFNAYGPSEMTVWVSSGRYVAGSDVVHIGGPIANTQCYVLDENRIPVPVGEPGELYVTGVGISREYLNRSELNAAKFLPNPFASELYPRLFKTGDRVRWRTDGNLEFLGRYDRQVKIRGFRVELEEIERVLETHPDVASAAVELQVEGSAKHVVAYVTPSPNAEAISKSEGVRATLSQWNEVFSTTYRSERAQPDCNPDPFADFQGWNSSFTGLPIPSFTMEDWRAVTVERIRSYAPCRVLEIGCGVGLLLSKIVPHCEQYCAIDIAAPVIAHLREKLALLGAHASKVELHVGAAHELAAFEGRRFDTIVINSVAQCFPNREYLDDLIAKLTGLLASGGRVFIGDVRHLGLNEAFHAAIELQQSSAVALDAAFRRRVAARVDRDKELVIAPDYFVHQARRHSSLGAVELLPKLGTRECEMNTFRYDVVLHHRDRTPHCDVQFDEALWSDIGSWDALSSRVNRTHAAILIRDIPNARIAAHVTVDTPLNAPQATDPIEWVHFAQTCGRTARFELSVGGGHDRFHVLLDPSRTVPFLDATRHSHLFSLDACSNDPWFNAVRAPLRQRIESYADTVLPDFMRPSAVMVLRRMPMSANGKIDRTRLMPVDRGGLEFVAARTEVERELCRIWGDLLGLAQVSTSDNFYRLGGDSLSAVRMQTAIKTSFALTVPLAELQQAATLADIAQQIELRLSRAKVEQAHAGLSANERNTREVLRL